LDKTKSQEFSMKGNTSSCSFGFDPLGKVTSVDLHHPNPRLFIDISLTQLAEFRASCPRVQTQQWKPIRSRSTGLSVIWDQSFRLNGMAK
jgi:hypothetical protein